MSRKASATSSRLGSLRPSAKPSKNHFIFHLNIPFQQSYRVPSIGASGATPPADICAGYRRAARAGSSGSSSSRWSDILEPRSPSALAECTVNSCFVKCCRLFGLRSKLFATSQTHRVQSIPPSVFNSLLGGCFHVTNWAGQQYHDDQFATKQ